MGDHMLEFSVADGLLLWGMPLVAALLVALVFVLIVRTGVGIGSELSPAATLHMNEDGSLSEVVEQEYVHALAA